MRGDVRHDASWPGSSGKPAASQSAQAAGEERDEAGIVDRLDGRVGVRHRRRPRRPASEERSPDRLRPSRQLGGRRPDAIQISARRLVEPVLVSPHEGDRQRHGRDPTTVRLARMSESTLREHGLDRPPRGRPGERDHRRRGVRVGHVTVVRDEPGRRAVWSRPTGEPRQFCPGRATRSFVDPCPPARRPSTEPVS